MALTVVLSGDTDIEQGQSTQITATVTDDNGNNVEGATVQFTASRGSFSDASVETDSSGEVVTTWEANFTDDNDVDTVITASASTPDNDSPTVDSATLTSLSDLGIENIVVNLLITSTGNIDISNNAAQVIYQEGSVGTAHPNSDPDINSELAVNRIRWSPNGRQLILNRSGTQEWRVWDDTHGELSVYVVTQSGIVWEFPVDEAHASGGGFINWNVDDTTEASAFLNAMGSIDSGDTLLLGFGDSDSIGIDGDTGSETITVTATAEVLEPTTLEIVSGNNQSANENTALSNPLIVRVLDQNGDALSGVSVSFSASPNDGTLSHTSVTTGSNGQAQANFTLGTTPGTYTITASVSGLTDVTFSATAVEVLEATTLSRISGNNQSAQVGTQLSDSLVVEVQDQNGDGLSGVVVSFSTTGGTLSSTSVTTGSNGRASVNLTLPNTAGNVTVTASVSGLTSVTFSATATAETLSLSWDVPTEIVDNTFSVTLESNLPITGVALSDFRLRRVDGVFYQLHGTDPNASATLTAVAGTNNYRIDITLTGTFDHNFQMRLRGNQIQHDGTNVPSVTLDSDEFHVESEAPVATTLEVVSGNNQSALVDEALTSPLVVRVLDQNGDPLSGIDVDFDIFPIDGILSWLSDTTDADGLAEVMLTFGSASGTYRVTASVSGLTDVEFTATANPLAATTLEIVSGDNQSGETGNQLSNPLVVRVLDQNGDAFSGETVTFSVDPSDGSLSVTSGTTDSNGRISTQLTLGDTEGDYTVTASVSGLTDVEFTATATEPLVATTLEIVSGNNQNAQVDNELPNSLVVRVLDQNGDALSGIDVSFSASPGSGSLSDTSVNTDSNGRASVTYTVGDTAGDYTITASVSGLTDAEFTATATAEPLVATTLELISGNNQSAVINSQLPNSLVVRVLDQNGDSLSGIEVTFSTTGGTLSDDSVTTGNNGRASITLTLSSTTGDYTVTASVSGLSDLEFTATATDIVDAVLEITLNRNSVIAGNSVIASFNFDIDVEDFDDDDVKTSPGSRKGVLNKHSDKLWTIQVNAPDEGEGEIAITVGEDSVTPGNNSAQIKFFYTKSQQVDDVETRLQYTTIESETIAGVIYKHYGVANEEILKIVLEANPNLSGMPLVLEQGVKIILPDIDVTHEIAPIALWS